MIQQEFWFTEFQVLFCYFVGVTVALTDATAFHSPSRGVFMGFLYVQGILLAIEYVKNLSSRKRIFSFLFLLFFLWLLLDFSIFMPDRKIQVNHSFHVKTFYLGTDGQKCRNEYMENHLKKHGIQGEYVAGFSVDNPPLEYKSYIGSFSARATPQTKDLVLLGSFVKSIQTGYLLTEEKDKWFLVLDNDAELDPEFTVRLPKYLDEDYDIIWLYSPIWLGLRLTGRFPCCTVGMVYQRGSVPRIVSKLNLSFLESHSLIDPENPQPHDLLLASLCNTGELRCGYAPLVRESKLKFPSTH